WDNPVLGTAASTAGSIGGAYLGTQLGTQLGAVGGPIGAIIGSFLATALGEAFSDQDFPYAIGTVGAENGRAHVSYTSQLDGGDEAAMIKAAEAIATSLNTIFGAYNAKPLSLSTSIGTTVARDGALLGGYFAGAGGTFNEGATYMGLDDGAEAAERAVLWGVETAAFENLPEELARVFDVATSFEDLKSFTDMVDFSVAWDEMTDAFLQGYQDWEKALGTVADAAAASFSGMIAAYLENSEVLFPEADATLDGRQQSYLAAGAAIDRLATGTIEEPKVSAVEAGLGQIGVFYAKLGAELIDEVRTIVDNGAQPESWNTPLASETIGGDVGKLTAALMEQGAGAAVAAFVETWSAGLDAGLMELTDPLGAKVAELGQWLARSLDDAALIEAAGGDGRAQTITATYNAMLADAVGDLYEPLLDATDQAVIALDGWRLAAVSYADETGHSLAEIERVYGEKRADILRAGLDDQLAATREAAGALVSALETAGRGYRSGLLDFDLQGMAALADVAMSGGDVGLAGATLGAQRAGLDADLLQRRLLDVIDLQIGAVEANTSAAQDIVAVFGDLGRRLIATADAFKIDPSLSPLAPLAQLEEVRRQWDVQADAADAAEARRVAALRGGDDAGVLAASEDLVEALGAMSGLGQSRIEAARGYYATSNFDDYWDVDAALRGWGEEIGELVDPAQASLDVARLQLDTLEDLRDQAARSIAQQVSAITGVSGDIGALQTMLDAALRAMVASQSALADRLGATGATTATSFDALAQAVYRAAPVSGQFGSDVYSRPGVEANRWVDFARALGYGGAVGGGQINALLASDPAFRARMEQAAQMYTAGRSAGIVGTFGFASGGIMTPRGPLPLEMYAEGGVARSPQLALFGEGRMPEAYVPLPDGRSIPVSLDWTPPANDDGGALIAVLREEVAGLRDEIRALRGVTAQGALDVGDAVRQGNRDLADLRGAAQRAAA
ncbi:MAG: hypothetical protein HQL38_16940, partial [Alphaproteobacteria bacterium]|nr:hypothetical protein [Alphaproteobacteria bacterium]